MFDIGFPELLLVSVVALLVLGPERLPAALRTLGLWLGRMRRSFNSVKTEIEREIGMDEVRRQLHNESIMKEMRNIEQQVRSVGSAIGDDIDPDSPANRVDGKPLQSSDTSAAESPATTPDTTPAAPSSTQDAGSDPAAPSMAADPADSTSARSEAEPQRRDRHAE